MHKPTAKFKAHLKRHKKVLSLLSSVIVLASFMLKEELAEHFKDEGARINEIILAAEKRRDHYATNEIVNAVDERVDVAIDLLKRSQKLSRGTDVDAVLNFQLGQLREIQARVEYAVILAGGLEDRAKIEKDGKELSRRTDALRVELQTIYEKPDRSAESDKIFKKDDEIRNLMWTTQSFALDALKAIHDRKDKIEKRNSAIQWCVFALFIAGWTVGLTLSVVGEHAASEG